MSLKISVVTPSFNSVSTIAGTIESVRSQDYVDWEHIVVDGGSKDGTLAVLERYPDRAAMPTRLAGDGRRGGDPQR